MASSILEHFPELPVSMHRDVDMGRYTTLGTGGRATGLVDVYDQNTLVRLIQWCDTQGVRWRILGSGSNVFVASQSFAGLFIRITGEFTDIRPGTQGDEDNSERLFVGAGVQLSRLVAFCTKRGLSGLEWAAGIPGTVGGAVFMNAGAYGSSMGEHLFSVTCLDRKGREQVLLAEQIEFSYRKTRFPENIVGLSPLILGTNITLTQDEKTKIQDRCTQYIQQRKKKLPVGRGTAGSFFKNPEGDYAGRLIEEAGLKGTAIGEAQVSLKHANVIVNNGQATPSDIVALMQVVQAEVKNQSGIDLEPEVQIF